MSCVLPVPPLCHHWSVPPPKLMLPLVPSAPLLNSSTPPLILVLPL
jgi:hypothetical protein